MRSLLALCFLLPGLASSADENVPASVDAAIARAAKAHVPVLLDFHAPWCYSCYFMATHVLNGKEWQAVEAKTIVTAVDADSPDGAAWMKKLQVKALPAYVILNENGAELGRILAEQPRAKFYPDLDKIIAGASTLDQLKAKAAKGSQDALSSVLASYQARGEGQDGLDWYAALPQKVRDGAGKNKTVALWLDRLQLAKASKAEDDAATIAAAQRVLAGDIGCDRPYVVDQLLEAGAKNPPPEYTRMLAQQKVALDRLLWERVFVAKPTCVDQRSAVMTTADVDAAIGDSSSETALLNRAIETVRQTLGDDVGKDRNLSDNLRVYLTRAECNDELDALYPKLIAAYPDDYVYPYRYGKSLLERKQAAKALPLLEQAAGKAYGENRLAVAMVRVKALRALKREADAEGVVAEVLEQNGQWFPEQVAKLKDALKS